MGSVASSRARVCLVSLGLGMGACSTGAGDSSFATFSGSGPTSSPPTTTSNGTDTDSGGTAGATDTASTTDSVGSDSATSGSGGATTTGASSGGGSTGGVSATGPGSTSSSTSNTGGTSSTSSTSSTTGGGSTSSTTGGGTSGGSTGAATTGAGSTGGGQTEMLQNSDGSCRDFLWCAETMNVDNGTGPHSYSECYTNIGLTPPFDVTEVIYAVTDVETIAPNAPTSLTLEVRQWTGAAPGAIIGTQVLGAADWQLGAHIIDLSQNPIQVNSASFCVGIQSNGAIQIARDPTNNVPNRAFIIASGCSINTFTAISSLGNFPGNYCINAKIEK